MHNEIVRNLEVFSEDEIASEIKLRPSKLDSFIGQEKMRRNLKVFLEAAKIRQKSLDHILLHGPPGLGKTTISHIVAGELGSNMSAVVGPMLSKVGDLAAILTNLRSGDVLFIDEIHRLPISVEEVLYSAMEDFRLDIVVGEGPAARTIKIDISPFTLVGATTRMGLISNPLRSRFGIVFQLEFYQKHELTQVVLRCADVFDIKIDKEAAATIASSARGTPRIAIRITKRVSDFALVEGAKTITEAIASNAIKKMGIDNYGLDVGDLKYLAFIAEKYSGGPVGIETIAMGLAEDRGSIEETIEPFLIQEGFIDKTPRGRMLTERAMTYLASKS